MKYSQNKTSKQKLAIKQFLSDRDGHYCHYCGCEKPLQKYAIDHFLSQNNGGSDDLYNLRLACQACNSSKNKYTIEQFRWARRISKSKYNGIINPRQARELLELGIDLPDIPEHKFHYEV